jgi:hypothetical protein
MKRRFYISEGRHKKTNKTLSLSLPFNITQIRVPTIRSKSLLGEIHKLPLRVISNVVKVEESSAFLGGNGGG